MTPDQKELLRHAVLESLAVRHPAALPPRAIRRRVLLEVDFPATDDDVTSALAVLNDLGLAHATLDPLGSTPYWQATAKGVLTHERGGTL